MIAKLKNIMLDDTPKCRNRTVVRLVMLAAWAKQSLLDDTPKCRSRAREKSGDESEREPGNQKAKNKGIVFSDTPKCRSEEARYCGREK